MMFGRTELFPEPVGPITLASQIRDSWSSLEALAICNNDIIDG